MHIAVTSCKPHYGHMVGCSFTHSVQPDHEMCYSHLQQSQFAFCLSPKCHIAADQGVF